MPLLAHARAVDPNGDSTLDHDSRLAHALSLAEPWDELAPLDEDAQDVGDRWDRIRALFGLRRAGRLFARRLG